MLRRRRHAGCHRLTGLCSLLPSVKTSGFTPPCCMDRRCGRTEPDPCSGLCDADILRASQLQHSVQHVGRDGHLGRLSPVRLEAQPLADDALPARHIGTPPGRASYTLRPSASPGGRARRYITDAGRAVSARALRLRSAPHSRAAARPRPRRDGGPQPRRRHRHGRRRHRR